MQRLFAQQIVRQDYDWQRENSEKESLWNNAMLIELEDFFFTSSWKTTGLNCRDRKILVSVNNFYHTRISLRKLAILNEIAKNAKSCVHYWRFSSWISKYSLNQTWDYFCVMCKIMKYYSIIYPKTQSSKLFALNKNYMKYHWYTVNDFAVVILRRFRPVRHST